MPLTPDAVPGVWHAATSTVRGTLKPSNVNRRLLKISFSGLPTGTTFSLYRGYIVDDANLMTTTLIGSRNSYDASRGGAPMELFANEAATLVWSGSGLTATSRVTAAIMSEWNV